MQNYVLLRAQCYNNTTPNKCIIIESFYSDNVFWQRIRKLIYSYYVCITSIMNIKIQRHPQRQAISIVPIYPLKTIVNIWLKKAKTNTE